LNNQVFSSMAHGGKRDNAGRKPKAEEIKLVEKLGPLEGDALDAIKEGVRSKDIRWIKLYLEYYVGRPKEFKQIEINEDVPLFID